MNCALVGCGNISHVHIDAIMKNPALRLVAVADIKPDRAKKAAETTGAVPYTDFEKMLRSEKIDCVHICTPHYLHTPMALKALDMGINVIVEKPCGVSKSEIDALISAQKNSGKQVGVCFQNRYNACVMRVREIVNNKHLGNIRCIRAFLTWSRGKDYYSDDWHGTLSKECGGVLINQAIHTLDIIQLLGGGAEVVACHTSNDHLQGVIEVEDTASVYLSLSGGGTAVFYATTAYGDNEDILIEAVFEKGKIRIEGEKLFVTGEDGVTKEDIADISKVFPGQKYWGTGHKALIDDFYECLESGRRFCIDAVEGGKAAKLVATCYNR